ncbi:MAG: bifunctional adenosylcobinamide kinase/adenosylcobinamide-phosphate guanylyltransferase [Clostridiales bacterium]|nr:bifunctional adenosylcobinamide kinase/adenosylcobinamide-phosphate guanylyltransferase [Clostridiales bacterium]
MILITGGAFQGKGTFARSLGADILEKAGSRETVNRDRIPEADGRFCESSEAENAMVWNYFTEWLCRKWKAGEPWEQELEQVLTVNPEIILVTRELGCGLVPIDAFDRSFRENHGRLCCRLAERASEVYRVSCGVAMKIKGDGRGTEVC